MWPRSSPNLPWSQRAWYWESLPSSLMSDRADRTARALAAVARIILKSYQRFELLHQVFDNGEYNWSMMRTITDRWWGIYLIDDGEYNWLIMENLIDRCWGIQLIDDGESNWLMMGNTTGRRWGIWLIDDGEYNGLMVGNMIDRWWEYNWSIMGNITDR